jgi:hypothetical protein
MHLGRLIYLERRESVAVFTEKLLISHALNLVSTANWFLSGGSRGVGYTHFNHIVNKRMENRPKPVFSPPTPKIKIYSAFFFKSMVHAFIFEKPIGDSRLQYKDVKRCISAYHLCIRNVCIQLNVLLINIIVLIMELSSWYLWYIFVMVSFLLV